MKHTSTPWSVGHFGNRVYVDFEEGREIAQIGVEGNETAEANAAFIVRAVNCHDQLVEALADIVALSPVNDPTYMGQLIGPWEAARSALAAARGEA